MKSIYNYNIDLGYKGKKWIIYYLFIKLLIKNIDILKLSNLEKKKN